MALTQVSTDGIKDLSVKNADIASAAAIVGTKISPDFGSQNIVTTGNVSVAGITATADIDLQDSDKILLGTGDDLQLYHDGTDSFIDNATGGLKILGDTIRLKGKSADETMLKGVVNGEVELYYNNTKKFETNSTGAFCTGQLGCDTLYMGDDDKAKFGGNDDLQIYHDGSHSFITNGTGDLVLGYSNIYLQPVSGENGLRSVANGATELYYDAVKKIETTGTGVTVTGGLIAGNIDSSGSVTVDDSEKFVAGVGNDLQIYHDGSQSYIVNTTSDLYIQCASDENAIETNQNAGVKLYYDGGNKLQTISSGVQINGDLQLQGDDGTNDSLLWDKSDYILKFKDGVNAEWGNSRDLRIYHSGSHSFIHQDGTGTLYLLADTFRLNNEANSENIIAGNADGQVQLYYDGSKKIQTASHGIDIVDDLVFDNGTNAGKDINWNEASNTMRWQDDVIAAFGAGDDLQLFHDGTDSTIDNNTGALYIKSNTSTQLLVNNTENAIIATADGAVELYYDGTKVFSTTASGAYVRGTEDGNATLNFYADEGDDNADSWLFQATTDGKFKLENKASGTWEASIRAIGGGATELYYDDVKKFETTTNGANINGIGVITGNLASNYIAQVVHDGNDVNRLGLRVQCGRDDGTGTNYAVAIADGDNEGVGFITFSAGTVSYGAFTAHHPCIIPDADNPSDNANAYPYGTLLETIDIQYTQKNGADTERGIRYKVQKTQSANSTKVLGVYGSSMNGGPDGQTNEHQALVLGDGHILCNNAGGNIEIGDGICSSSTAGIGQKATINPSMIIGIAQEAVNFTGSETKLVAVQYGLQQFIPWT